eukprot:10245473-Alexandrium_andersonii.AAC.1
MQRLPDPLRERMSRGDPPPPRPDFEPAASPAVATRARAKDSASLKPLTRRLARSLEHPGHDLPVDTTVLVPQRRIDDPVRQR